MPILTTGISCDTITVLEQLVQLKQEATMVFSLFLLALAGALVFAGAIFLAFFMIR